MPEKRQHPTASIPSKHRARSAHGDVRGSLIVTKLDGGTLLDDNDVRGVLNDVILPNAEALSKMNSSRLKKEIKFKINNMEYDPRSLELLIRLLRSGSLASDVINDENRQPSTELSLDDRDVTQELEDVADGDLTSSRMFIISSPNSNASHRVRRTAVTSNPSSKFRRSIEALKSARERFGVSMAVNGNIAKARTVQQQNLKDRKAGRERLPMLACQSNCEATMRDKNMPLIPYRKSWLALSGRQIQLKHQGHVERVLGHPEPKSEESPTIKKKRSAKSAPPRAASNIVPLHRFSLSDSNRYVIQKVSKTFRNAKSPINLPGAIHGYHSYHSFSPSPELRSADIDGVTNDVTKELFRKSPDIQENKKNVSVDVAKELKKPIPVPFPPGTMHEQDPPSRPSSATMPRPVRSVVIKIPKSDSMTPPATVLTPSRPAMTQRVANSFPSKPTVKFNLRQKT